MALVLELQKEALGSNVRVSDLLRRALLTARKLGVDDMRRWAESELNGYDSPEAIPKYRRVRGEIRAFNPHRGYIPVMVADAHVREQLTVRPCLQSVAELEDLQVAATGPDTKLVMQLSPAIAMDMLGAEIRGGIHPPAVHIPAAAITRILDVVRSTVLNWALDLEERGVLGEGATFTSDERKAAERTTYSVTNIIGPSAKANVQVGAHGSSQGAGHAVGGVGPGNHAGTVTATDHAAPGAESAAGLASDLIGVLEDIQEYVGSNNEIATHVVQRLEALHERIAAYVLDDGSDRRELVSMLSDLWHDKVRDDLKPAYQRIVEKHMPAVIRSLLLKAILGGAEKVVTGQ